MQAIIKTNDIDPEQTVKEASSIATALANIINKQNLFTVITNKTGAKSKYVHVTGWGILMAMRGVSPCVTRCEKLNREGEVAYESDVELISHDGKVVGKASAICSSKERNKSYQEEYAIKSMSQTRATGKAARLSFAWIMKLAGYEPTPAEEMNNALPDEPLVNQTTVRARSSLANSLRASVG
ncbi:hypothetical protein GAMM_200033 [Gammaproteobacteria bacterium]